MRQWLCGIILVLAFGMVTSLSGKVIEGYVFDGENGLPLEYVNVLGMDIDSVFVEGSVTDSLGAFRLAYERISILKFNMIGYDEVSIRVPSVDTIPLSVQLVSKDVKLGEVEVNMRKPQTRLVGGAIETTIAGTSLAGILNVFDMFRFIPMLSVQGDNVEVFGKGMPVYYINNRKVRDMTEVSNLRPEDIQSVKVITNPGSRYNSESGSVIVIRTRKVTGEGVSGSIEDDFGGFHRYHNRLNAKMWYRKDGLELSGQLFHACDNYQNTISYNSDIYTTTPKTEDYINHYFYKGNRYQAKVGFNYDINVNHSLGGYYMIFGSKFSTGGHTRTALTTALSTDSWEEDESGHSTTYPYHSANLYYEGRIGKVSLSANFDYLGSKADTETRHEEYGGALPSRQFTTNGSTASKLYAGNLTATYSYKNGEILLGQEITDTDYRSAFDNPNGIVRAGQSKTEETAIAAFASWRQQSGAFNWSVGVRYEHRKTIYEDGSSEVIKEINNDIFPTLDFGGKHGGFSWNIGYAYRLQRSMFSQLSGNIVYMNRYTYQSGNPNLRPLRKQQFYISVQYRDFWLSGGFMHNEDTAVHSSDIFGDNDDMILQHWVNFPPYNSFYLYTGYQITVRHWSPALTAGINKQSLSVPFLDNSLLLDRPMWSLSLRNQLRLPEEWTIYANYAFTSSGDELTSRIQPCHELTFGLTKEFLKGALSLQLWAYDILDRQTLRYVKYDSRIFRQGFTDRENRQIALRIRYQFNATRSHYKGQGAGSAEKQRL